MLCILFSRLPFVFNTQLSYIQDLPSELNIGGMLLDKLISVRLISRHSLPISGIQSLTHTTSGSSIKNGISNSSDQVNATLSGVHALKL